MLIKPTEDLVRYHFNDPPFLFKEKLDVAPPEEVMAQKAMFNVSIEEGLKLACDYTRSVLLKIEKHFKHDRKYVYVDVKVQRIAEGDSPTEISGCQWHLDGIIQAPGLYAQMLGKKSLIDVKASVDRGDPPRFFLFHTSDDCPTEFVAHPVDVVMPKCLENFFEMDDILTKQCPDLKTTFQPAGSVVEMPHNSVHRGIRARRSTTRLWIRVSESNTIPVRRRYPINSTFHMTDELKQEIHLFNNEGAAV